MTLIGKPVSTFRIMRLNTKRSPALAGLLFYLGKISSENRYTLFRITPWFDALFLDQ
jgi:hypothetical protein